MEDPSENAQDPTPTRRAGDLPPDAPWWARWLDANVREAWRWASVRWSGAIAVVAEVYANNTETINAYVQHQVPANWWPHIVALASLVALLLRISNLKVTPTPKG